MEIRATPEFLDWRAQLDPRSRTQVDDRLDRIREHNHFGERRYLGGGLCELKWKNGRRVYYATILDENGNVALMLLGGDKNGQNRDISQARKLYDREAP